jgi:hypothetical protein
VVAALNGTNVSANSLEAGATPVIPPLGNIPNYGFETPVTSTYQYAPTGGSWSFTPLSGTSGSGISANGSAFTSGNPNAPQGVQVAFLQGTGSISQALMGLIVGAIYQITFAAAQRNNIYGAQTGETWQMKLAGKTIGSYAPPESAQSYVTYSATFTAPAGNPTLAFVGTDANGGDNTVFIDDVQLGLSPSLTPPQLGWQMTGGQVQIFWPADHAGWSLELQDNPLNAGLGTNWVTVSGSNLTNAFVFPMDPAGGSVFFRLVYP